jgi:cystathionine beta-lyase
MDFEYIYNRENTNCEKYDLRMQKFGKTDITPLWVADMDFAISDEISTALSDRLSHPIFGYAYFNDEYFESIQQWMYSQHEWKLKLDSIIPINSIVSALNLSVELFTNIGDKVLIQTPIYPPFMGAVKHHNREILENKLVLINDHYEIDFEDFEEKAKKAKLFLFCSPHNPTGRVFRKWELERIVEISQKYNLIIISDEVHADLVYDGFKHIPISKIADAKEFTITLNAPSKTFNVASIVNAYAICENNSLRRKFNNFFEKRYLANPNPFSIQTTVAAYSKSMNWYKTLMKYLDSNLYYLLESFSQIPQIKPIKPEATYLLWLDCKELGLNDKELEDFFIKRASLGLNSGVSFSQTGSGFMRLNFATHRKTLEQSIKNLKNSLIY